MNQGQPRIWLTGESVEPWELKVKFTHKSMPKILTYKYSLWNEIDEETIWEREPSRRLEILDPSEYKKYKNYGTLPSQDKVLKWPNVDKVFLVNGHIEKVDANFVGGLSFDQIGDSGIFIGPYP